MNKRGQETGFALLMASVVLVILFIVFILGFGMFGGGDAESTIQKDVGILDEQMFMYNYLRTPVDDMDMLMLINLYVNDKGTYAAQLEAETVKVMDMFFGEDVCWTVTIGDDSFKNKKECEFNQPTKRYHKQVQLMSTGTVDISVVI